MSSFDNPILQDARDRRKWNAEHSEPDETYPLEHVDDTLDCIEAGCLVKYAEHIPEATRILKRIAFAVRGGTP